MKYWWVNQNKTHKQEISGGFMWSPKTKINGTRNPYYDFMTNVQVGDVIFSYYQQKIRAIGVAKSKAMSSAKPDFGAKGNVWSHNGWMVEVDFFPINVPVSPKNYPSFLSTLNFKYSPLKLDGSGKELYLTNLDTASSSELVKIFRGQIDQILSNNSLDNIEEENAAEESNLKGRTDIAETFKKTLTDARRGQGLFKANVKLNEQKCRVTGLSDPSLLIASHIKAWRYSSDEEKLHGCNGLLLSPHIDKLFDKGLISFSDTGELLISAKLDPSVLVLWNINPNLSVGKFSSEQAKFLLFHRNKYGYK